MSGKFFENHSCVLLEFISIEQLFSLVKMSPGPVSQIENAAIADIQSVSGIRQNEKCSRLGIRNNDNDDNNKRQLCHHSAHMFE